MGNRATPPRSFNTIRQSQYKKRAKRDMQRRILLLAICAVLILIFLAVSVLLVCSIVDAVSSSLPNNGNGTPQGEQQKPQEPIRYQQITKEQVAVGYGPLILINGTHEYHFPSAAERTLAIISEHRPKDNGTNIYQITGPTTAKMQMEAINAFNEMMLDYYEIYEDGSINVSSAYRSYKDQESYSVKAGFSDHHSGYCIALDGVEDSSHWIYENCKKYGFIPRYPDNKVNETGVDDYEECFRYVGVAHASYMTKNDYCLEEYVKLLQDKYDSETHLKFKDTGGNEYEVYYVSVSKDDEVSTFSVPANYSYTVSGDNEGGFIVTVNLSDPLN